MIELSPQTLHAIAWTLLHFVWQGAALGALLVAALAFTRNANVRYALGVATLMLMIAAPVVTFTGLNRAPASITAIDTSAVANVSQGALFDQAVRSEAVANVLAAGADRQQMLFWLVQVWLAGVILLSVRTAGGLIWLGRARRGLIDPLPQEILQQCLMLQQRMGLHRRIRFGHCRWLDAPAVMGWFRPIVLVTSQALTGLNPQQLQAIIVHELAHIRRHDAFVNLFQLVAEVLLFYHPAVWWVSRRIRIEREVCCDNEAIGVCAEPVSYARALTLMEEWRAAPVMMMAANRGPLSERVFRLLGVQGTSARSHVVALGLSIACIAVALFAGNILVTAAQAAVESPAQLTERAPVVPREVEAPAPAAPAREAAPAKPAEEPQPPRPASQPPAPPKPPGKIDKAASEQSYMGQLEALGLKDLSVDELIAMKVQGITPEYVQNLFAMQFRPSADELIAMKVQGVTPSYIEETRRLVADPTIDDVIAMKVQGVTPRYIHDMQAAGLDVRTADDVIALAVQGIRPELVKAAVEHGFQDLTVDKLMALRDADVF